jgi:hypothetical protein
MSRLATLEALPGGEDPTTRLEPLSDEDYRDADQR